MDNGLTWEAIAELDGDGLPLGRINSDWNAGTNNFLSDRDPEVETDRAGNWVAVWHKMNPRIVITPPSGQKTVYDEDIFTARSTDGGLTWTPLETLNSNADTDGTVADRITRLETNKNGVWIVLWQSHTSL